MQTCCSFKSPFSRSTKIANGIADTEHSHTLLPYSKQENSVLAAAVSPYGQDGSCGIAPCVCINMAEGGGVS
jgi:hypothetical protein